MCKILKQAPQRNKQQRLVKARDARVTHVKRVALPLVDTRSCGKHPGARACAGGGPCPRGCLLAVRGDKTQFPPSSRQDHTCARVAAGRRRGARTRCAVRRVCPRPVARGRGVGRTNKATRRTAARARCGAAPPQSRAPLTRPTPLAVPACTPQVAARLALREGAAVARARCESCARSGASHAAERGAKLGRDGDARACPLLGGGVTSPRCCCGHATPARRAHTRPSSMPSSVVPILRAVGRSHRAREEMNRRG
jgi:hypothetical protein